MPTQVMWEEEVQSTVAIDQTQNSLELERPEPFLPCAAQPSPLVGSGM